MDKKPAHLTELEERLAAPEGAALRAQLLAQLTNLELDIRRRLAGMVPRAEYAQLAASAEAARAAQETLKAWPAGEQQRSRGLL